MERSNPSVVPALSCPPAVYFATGWAGSVDATMLHVGEGDWQDSGEKFQHSFHGRNVFLPLHCQMMEGS
jgi:hypothetical protein